MPRKKDRVEKVSTSVRLTPEAFRLLTAIAARLGVSQSAVMELAIREKARKEEVE
jgi:predicted transcriptional regulator